MKFLIVEDIKSTCEMIANMIVDIEGAEHSIDKSYSKEDAFEKILAKEYDILFLDINLPIGTSFDLLHELSQTKKVNSQIIFLTGQDEREYLMKAIKFSAIDYLYKPIDKAELTAAISKAKVEIENQEKMGQVAILMDLVAHEKDIKHNNVAFHLPKGKIINLNTENIIYMMAEGPVTKIVLDNGNQYTAVRNLGHYKEFLQAYYDYFLVSKSILINLGQLDTYHHKNLKVKMKNGEALSCSRRGGKLLKEHMQKSLNKPTVWSQLRNFLNS